MARIGIIADINQHHTRRWIPYFVVNNVVTLINPRPLIPKIRNTILSWITFLKNNSSFDYVFLPLNKFNFMGYLKYLINLRKVITNKKIELLYLHNISLASFLTSFICRLPIVLCPWGSDILIFPQKNIFFRFMAKRLIKRADLIVSISSSITDKCIQYGAKPEKIKLIPMGVNLNVFHPKINVDDLREKYKLSPKEKVVLSIRNFAPLYNIDTIIRAVPIIVSKYSKVRFFLLVGHGAQDDYLKEIKDLISSLNISQYINLIGYLANEEVPRIYNLADIIISIPSSDAFGCSLHEAMACQVAPIVSDLPAMYDFFKDKENALIVPVRNHERLAKAITTLLNDEEKRNKFAVNNLTLVWQKADAQKNVAELEKEFNKVITASKGKAYVYN